MRKLHIALLSVFATGVLLGGIGTGIAFGEYSGLEYQGEVMLGEENLVTTEFCYDFSMEDEKQVVLNYCHWGDEAKNTLVVEDASVPAGTICYVVTYNEEMVRPKLVHWEQELEEEGWRIIEDSADEVERAALEAEALAADFEKAAVEESADAADPAENAADPAENAAEQVTRTKRKTREILELNSYWWGNEFDVVMKNKDRILEDLKQKKIGTYEVAGVTDVEIRVNPVSMPYIEDNTR